MSDRTDTQVLERCLRILRWLAVHRQTTVTELHALFEGTVSIRTLQRDLERLSMANVPLTTDNGRGREHIWKLTGKFSEYIPQLLGDDEITAALLVNELAKVVSNTPLAAGVQQLQERLQELLPVDILLSRKSDAFPAGSFFLAQSGIVDLRPYGKQIRTFVDATKLRQMITINYHKPMEAQTKLYLVEPYGIIFYGEALYGVVRHCERRNFLTLPFHRMEDVTMLETKFERESSFSLQDLRKERIGIFGDSNQKPVEVVIRFFPPVSHTIGERNWHASQSIEQEEDGKILLRLQVILSEELVAWILRWQHYAVVVKPENLIDWVHTAVSETLKRYANES